jgi:hypothetical protein
MWREGVEYKLHHIGIPTDQVRLGERYASSIGMYTSDDLSGPLPIQWHRFEANSPLHSLLRTQPHCAYKVSDLAAAIDNHAVVLGPYEPIDGFLVAVIDNAGQPVEFIQTALSDDVIWHRATTGEKSTLYCPSAVEASEASPDGAGK